MSEGKKLKIDLEKCSGCGTCIALCPEVFELNDEGKSVVKNQDACNGCNCQDAVDSCPEEAITWE